MLPERIQMSRQRPWRENSPDAVVIARPAKWGNPFQIGGNRPELFVFTTNGVVWTTPRSDSAVREAHTEAARRFPEALIAGDLGYTLDDVRRELAGRPVACWCAPDLPCHGDDLIHFANSDE